MSAYELAERLLPDWSIAKRAALVYACRCIAHRLRTFGFEEQVNLYSPRELALLATMLPDHAQVQFLAEARRRAEASADTELVELLTPEPAV